MSGAYRRESRFVATGRQAADKHKISERGFVSEPASRTQTPRSALGVGLATLVTIMVAVLLTTFSVLALVSAQADLRLSFKVTTSLQDQYRADSEAEEWLATLDTLVSQSPDDLLGTLEAMGYQVSTGASGRIVVTQVFRVDDIRDLTVEVALEDGQATTILRWQTSSRQ